MTLLNNYYAKKFIMRGVTILGNNAAVPVPGKHPSAQVLTTANRELLIDCGEGTQIQLLRYKIKPGKITHVFISHLHGDHYFGLIGLINSMGLFGRVQPLHIIAPAGLKKIFDTYNEVGGSVFRFPILFQPIEQEGVLCTIDVIEVSCFKTEHSIECYGFLFKEKKLPRKILPAAVNEFNIPYHFYKTIQEGRDYTTSEGVLVKNERLTIAAAPGKSYAYCADTRYTESFLPYIKNADMIYHESTYLNELTEEAKNRYHSTTVQAAGVAKKAGVKKLLLGHFSNRFPYIQDYENEARSVFPASEATYEGVTYLFP